MPAIIHSLRRLLGLRSTTPPQAPTPSPEAQARKQFDALNKVAPIQGSGSGTAQTSSSSNDPSAFICRVPVLNRKEHVAGYTFNLQENLQSRLQGKQDLLHKVYDDALLRSLTSLGIHSLLGHRLAFIGLHPVSLDNPLLYKLPQKTPSCCSNLGANLWHWACSNHSWKRCAKRVMCTAGSSAPPPWPNTPTCCPWPAWATTCSFTRLDWTGWRSNH